MRVEISVEFHCKNPTAVGLCPKNMIVPKVLSHHLPQVIESLIFGRYLATWNKICIS